MEAVWVAIWLLGAAAFLCAFSFIGAWVSGWRALARFYRTDLSPRGRRWRFRHGRIGGVTYGGVLTFGSGSGGLYVRVALPYRLGHPPLLIPWQELTLSVVRGWAGECFVFHSTKVPETGIRVGKKFGQALIKASAGRG